MTYRERYKIALEKAKKVEKMPFSQYKKEEIYRNLGEWINTDKTVEEMPFPFGKIPRKI